MDLKLNNLNFQVHGMSDTGLKSYVMFLRYKEKEI